MKAKNASLLSELLAGIFGWVWITSLFATPTLLIWALFGEGKWYYPVISFAIGAFCKSLCREYKKQSEKFFYESKDKDYTPEWINILEEDKYNFVLKALKQIILKSHPNENVEEWVQKLEKNNQVDEIKNEITKWYKETGLRKPYHVVCKTFIENYIISLAE